jgi:hypothetical protein
MPLENHGGQIVQFDFFFAPSAFSKPTGGSHP